MARARLRRAWLAFLPALAMASCAPGRPGADGPGDAAPPVADASPHAGDRPDTAAAADVARPDGRSVDAAGAHLGEDAAADRSGSGGDAAADRSGGAPDADGPAVSPDAPDAPAVDI